jgi:osmotically-inducible protein OsmY
MGYGLNPSNVGNYQNTNRFGTPLYGTTTQSGTGTSSQGASVSQPSGSFGPVSSGTTKAPEYTTGSEFTPTSPTASRLQGEVREIILSSSKLPSKENIQVAVEGSTVVLKGKVSDDHERRLAQIMVQFTPGVRAVRNELEVR